MIEADGQPPSSAPRLLFGRVGSIAQEEVDETLRLLRALRDAPNPRPVIRAYRPPPTVAFSRRESLMPEFTAASAAAVSFGFDPVIRLAGGRAVAYDESCLVIDLITPLDLHQGHLSAFDAAADSFRNLLRDLGVDARVGQVAGEYCAGNHSVNARGQVKIVGIAQRVMRGARLLTASVVLESPDRLRPVVDAVYGEMNLEWSQATLGSLRDEGVPLSRDEMTAELVTGLHERHTAWASPQATWL